MKWEGSQTECLSQSLARQKMLQVCKLTKWQTFTKSLRSRGLNCTSVSRRGDKTISRYSRVRVAAKVRVQEPTSLTLLRIKLLPAGRIQQPSVLRWARQSLRFSRTASTLPIMYSCRQMGPEAGDQPPGYKSLTHLKERVPLL